MPDVRAFVSAKVIALALALSAIFIAIEASMCDVCNDKRYIISTRSDGLRAVERCDECAAELLSDEQAAILARHDGVECDETYPCYLKEKR